MCLQYLIELAATKIFGSSTENPNTGVQNNTPKYLGSASREDVLSYLVGPRNSIYFVCSWSRKASHPGVRSRQEPSTVNVQISDVSAKNKESLV